MTPKSEHATPINIVTATYNAEATVERCLKSVAGQDYNNLNHILIDGASNDRTVSIVRANAREGHTLICEPDTGVYSAWNKGLDLCHDGWVMFLGADDWLLGDTVISEVMSRVRLCPTEPGYVSCGVLKEQSINGRNVSVRKYGWHVATRRDGFLPVMPPHPGLLHSAALFKSHRFDESYRACSDAKLFWSTVSTASLQYVDKDVTHFSLGGITNRDRGRFGRVLEKVRFARDLGMIFSSFAAYQEVLKSAYKEIVARLKKT
jgi:glycosyltransferase